MENILTFFFTTKWAELLPTCWQPINSLTVRSVFFFFFFPPGRWARSSMWVKYNGPVYLSVKPSPMDIFWTRWDSFYGRTCTSCQLLSQVTAVQKCTGAILVRFWCRNGNDGRFEFSRFIANAPEEVKTSVGVCSGGKAARLDSSTCSLSNDGEWVQSGPADSHTAPPSASVCHSFPQFLWPPRHISAARCSRHVSLSKSNEIAICDQTRHHWAGNVSASAAAEPARCLPPVERSSPRGAFNAVCLA